MDYTSARLNMVESQIRTVDVTDATIQDAMRRIRRERFVMPGREALAYADRAVEYAPGRSLMMPRDVAKLLQALRPRPGERALALAAPYAAAVLAHMGLQVTALETPEADAHARLRLEGEGVPVVAGDLSQPAGTWDLIVSEGAVAAVPQSWLDGLDPHGRLGAVVRRGDVGKATVFQRTGEALAAREVFDAAPPFIPGFEPQSAFVF